MELHLYNRAMLRLENHLVSVASGLTQQLQLLNAHKYGKSMFQNFQNQS